jgi:hypothetical protein
MVFSYLRIIGGGLCLVECYIFFHLHPWWSSFGLTSQGFFVSYAISEDAYGALFGVFL